MDSAVRVQKSNINDSDRDYLDKIAPAVSLIADLSRADILLCLSLIHI